MSDEEYSEEEYSEEEREEKRVAKPQEHQEHKEEPKLKHVERKDAEEEAPPREMTEAERAMEAARRKKKEEDEARWAEYQQLRAIERAKEEEELKRLKDRQTMRRKERDEEDARMAEQRRIMEEQRQLEETEIMARKSEEKKRRLAEAERRRMELMGATGQTDASNSPNFVITKKANEGTSKEAIGKRSAAQLEREKEAYMKKRVKPCNVSGWDAARLKEKAQQLHARIIKLETERFDLEQKSQRQEYDLKELNEREKQVKKQRALKKGLDPTEAESPLPPKVAVASKYDRQVDHRSYGQKRDLYTQPPPPPPDIKRTGKIWTMPYDEDDVVGQEQAAPPPVSQPRAPEPEPEEVAVEE